MTDKVLVTIEVDIWKSCEPVVRIEEIEKVSDKCIMLYRDVHLRGYFSSRFVENRLVTVRKVELGIRPKGPGHVKATMLLPKQPDVREDPNFKETVKVMLDTVTVEMRRAWNRLDSMWETVREDCQEAGGASPAPTKETEGENA